MVYTSRVYVCIIHNKEIGRRAVSHITLPKTFRIGFVNLIKVINPKAHLGSKLLLITCNLFMYVT